MLRAFRICKNIASISSWTWVMPNLVKAWKSAGILPLCLTGYEIFTFSCLSIFFGPRGISGYPRHGPQSTRWLTRRLSLYKLLLAFAGLDSTLEQKNYPVYFPFTSRLHRRSWCILTSPLTLEEMTRDFPGFFDCTICLGSNFGSLWPKFV